VFSDLIFMEKGGDVNRDVESWRFGL